MKFRLSIGTKFLLAALFLGASAFLGFKRSDSSWHSQFAGNKVFPALQVKDIKSMTVSAGPFHTTLLRNQDSWTVKERNGHPADTLAIDKTIAALVSMKTALRLEEMSARELKDLGLEPSHSSGPVLKAFDANGKQLAELALGKAHYRGGGAPLSQQDRPDARYCIATGANGKASPLLSSTLFQWLEPEPGHWLMPPSFDMTKTLAIAVQGMKAPSWSASRKSLTERFLFDAPQKGEPNPKELSALLSVLARPQLIDVLTIEPPPIEETIAVSVKVEGGQTLLYTFGLGGGRAIMKVAVDGNPAKDTYEINPGCLRPLVKTP